LFYSNKISSRPEGDLIDEIHREWFDDVGKLEYHHGYIQWLFPLFLDSGVNSSASALKKDEAQLMRNDLEIARRVIRSYRLMLNFYGWHLVDEKTGEISKHPNENFRRNRYRNLNDNFHNNLRISRILISLGELGFGRYKEPLLNFLAIEVNSGLRNCKESFDRFWKRLVQVDTQWYFEKTRETAEDREESIFFRAGNGQVQDFLAPQHLGKNAEPNLEDEAEREPLLLPQAREQVLSNEEERKRKEEDNGAPSLHISRQESEGDLMHVEGNDDSTTSDHGDHMND